MKKILKKVVTPYRLVCAMIGVLLVAYYAERLTNPVWLIGSFITSFLGLLLLDSIELLFVRFKRRKAEKKV